MGYEIIVRKYDDDGKMLKESKVNRDDKLFNGYFVAGDQGSGCTCEIEHMSQMDIATCIEADETLLFSAILAEAMERGMRIKDKRKKEREIKEMKENIEKIFGDR